MLPCNEQFLHRALDFIPANAKNVSFTQIKYGALHNIHRLRA